MAPTLLNPGNSGGSLLNENGRGDRNQPQIETSCEHAGNVGTAFAVPIDAAKSEFGSLRNRGYSESWPWNVRPLSQANH